MREIIERPERIALCLTKEEKRFIEDNAAKEDMSLSAYVRKMLIKKIKEEQENDGERVQSE